MRIDIRPIITEKTVELKKLNKYVMFIPDSVNKIELKQFLQSEYNLVVNSINILKKPSKVRRRRQIVGKSKQKKKAIVSIDKNSDFKEFDNLF